MPHKNTAVFGIYPNRVAAEEALSHLHSAGFRNTDTSALFPENQGTKDLAVLKNTKAPEGFVIGAIVGVIIGGAVGWLVGSGVWYVPELAPLASAGAVVATLAGLGALGVVGAIIGALIGTASPEYEAKRYGGRIRNGGVLLSVHCDSHDWVKRAKDVLEHTGAQDIAAEGEKSGDFANNDKPLPRVPNTPPPPPVTTTRTVVREEPYVERTASRTIPVVETPVVGEDEVYTERLVRRRNVQDPDRPE
jgi:hypothetical protein